MVEGHLGWGVRPSGDSGGAQNSCIHHNHNYHHNHNFHHNHYYHHKWPSSFWHPSQSSSSFGVGCKTLWGFWGCTKLLQSWHHQSSPRGAQGLQSWDTKNYLWDCLVEQFCKMQAFQKYALFHFILNCQINLTSFMNMAKLASRLCLAQKCPLPSFLCFCAAVVKTCQYCQLSHSIFYQYFTTEFGYCLEEEKRQRPLLVQNHDGQGVPKSLEYGKCIETENNKTETDRGALILRFVKYF